ncbi:MAG: CtsR family transcriptional regulator [Clostridia bacterium]|nr:CtsR family transcriptional regulator [Clostridia bacterium]
MVLSEQIARMIEEMLDEAGGSLSLGRNELATRLGCVPSQINYVITSRFTPARGYLVESRRGGGGYVRITRLQFDRRKLLLHFYDAVGKTLSDGDCVALVRALLNSDAITEKEARVMLAMTGEDALSPLSPADRGVLRAHLIRTAILRLAAQ